MVFVATKHALEKRGERWDHLENIPCAIQSGDLGLFVVMKRKCRGTQSNFQIYVRAVMRMRELFAPNLFGKLVVVGRDLGQGLCSAKRVDGHVAASLQEFKEQLNLLHQDCQGGCWGAWFGSLGDAEL